MGALMSLPIVPTKIYAIGKFVYLSVTVRKKEKVKGIQMLYNSPVSKYFLFLLIILVLYLNISPVSKYLRE